MSDNDSNEISQAVLHTLLYSDVFDYPLTAREVHRFLHGTSATYAEVLQSLSENPRIMKVKNYFVLKGRQDIINIREQRQAYSQRLMPYALRLGRMIGSLPYVRMVALTGSLAVMNAAHNVDFDYMLVTTPGRLWTARAFTLLFNRFTRLFGWTICPNLIVSTNSLKWHQQDLYTARELCQMIPITGMDAYQRLWKENAWVKEFLPNASMESNGSSSERVPIIQRVLEVLFRGTFGHRFEEWEMNRKIARFSRQDGFGEETMFSADICQGNFDHHHSRTRKELERRLESLETREVHVDAA